MRLRTITLMNFRSVNGTIRIDIDPRVTILLGSNDHGKSNILEAFTKINRDVGLEEKDANWDAVGERPELEFQFVLSEAERDSWLLSIPQQPPAPQPNAETTVAVSENPVPTEGTIIQPSAPPNFPQPTIGLSNEALITLARRGVGANWEVQGIPVEQLPKALVDTLTAILPRVELINPVIGSLQDTVNASQITTPDFEFMQGIFFMAGLNPMDSQTLFKQDDETIRRLQTASGTLNENLQRLWEQGQGLTFSLQHVGDAIQLVVNDPAVTTRVVRMSARSSGVTQFFRVSMILFARQQKNPANFYIYLFDEPGVFLHVQGQKDLLQVFEQIAERAQIIYSTHSLFMLNQNFPERHRLIFKDNEGTKVDQKPYRANWRRATDSLGVFWSSNILFSNKVLLVEGDSDPLYIYEAIRQSNRRGLVDADANVLGVMSFANEANLRFLLQQFRGQGQENRVMVLLDGDKEAGTIQRRAKDLCSRLEVPIVRLQIGSSIEDYVLFVDNWLNAVVQSLRDALEAEGKEIPVNIAERVREAWDEFTNDRKVTAGRWFVDVAKQLINEEVSKVALARNYGFLCRESPQAEPNAANLERMTELAKKIIEALAIPSSKAREEIIKSAAG